MDGIRFSAGTTKRPRESEELTSVKRMKVTSLDNGKIENQIFPNEIWQLIIKFLVDTNDTNTMCNLRLTARCIAADNAIYQSLFSQESVDDFYDLWRKIGSSIYGDTITHDLYSDRANLSDGSIAPFDAIYATFYQQIVEACFDYRDEAELPWVMSSSASAAGYPNQKSRYQGLANYCIAAKQLKEIIDGGCKTGELIDKFLACAKFGHFHMLEYILLNVTRYQSFSNFINFASEKREKTALSCAAEKGREKTFRYLLQNGATFVKEASEFSEKGLVEFDVGHQHFLTVTPLHILALQSEKKWLCDILDRFSDRLIPAVFSKSFAKNLRYIIKNDTQGLTESLAATGNNPVLSENDVNGWNLLHWAASLEADCVKVLTDKGMLVDEESADGAVLPISIACFSGNLSAFKLLVALKAEIPESLDLEDNTFLHIAVSRGDFKFVEYLIQELKMDVNKSNYYDDTPYKLAQLQVDSEGDALPLEKIEQKTKCLELLS